MAGFTKIRIMPVEEAEGVFERKGSNIAKLDDYVDTLRSMDIGQGFTVHVTEEEITSKTKDGTEVTKIVEIVPDTIDDDGKADTVRMFKRRMNAAADSLDVHLKWKAKGHRVTDTDGEARNVLDWLIARIEEGKVTTSNGETEDKVETTEVEIAGK